MESDCKILMWDLGSIMALQLHIRYTPSSGPIATFVQICFHLWGFLICHGSVSWAATVAQWIRLRLSSCPLRLESHASRPCFFNFYLKCKSVKRTKIKKESGNCPLIKLRQKQKFWTLIFKLEFLNGPTRPIFRLFLSFQTNITIYNKLMWKMSSQYPAPGFKITAFWSLP